MNEEKIIVSTEEDNNATVNVEDVELAVEQEETIEYIEVEPSEEMVINVEESIGSVGGNSEITHYGLPDRNDSNQHTISAITGLEDILKRISSVKDSVYSVYGGFAEFRPWLKGGYYKTDSTFAGTGGIGYFVSLVTATGNIEGNNIYIDICRKKNTDGTVDTTDVYGVTVASSGICGYQDTAYDILDESVDKSNSQDYAKVCLLGDVKVRVTAADHLKIKVGDYVVPNEDGYAVKSENNVGFKVISKGQIETAGSSTTAWYYVDIALVPQNDNVSRVMEELENTRGSLNNVILDVGNMGDVITNMQDVTIQMSGKVDGFEDILNESEVKISEQLKTAQEAITKAQEIASQAEQTINVVAIEYSEAVSKADEAQKTVNDVLDDVNVLKADIQPLAEWTSEDGTSAGIVGFVAQANKDSTTLASMTEAFGQNGSDLTAIIQKIDENGAAIQHLVSHVDKYIIGEHSPVYNLTLEQAQIIQPGTIYVPTNTDSHIEEYGDKSVTFNYGMSYIWGADDQGVYIWKEYKIVSTSAGYSQGKNDEDLWYCWQGVLDNNTNKYLYNPGTLYCWNGSIWVPVAVNGGTSSVVGLINQTATKLSSIYTDLNGQISSLEQTVDSISTTVQNEVKDQISSIHQTAEEIMMGVYDPDGSSSLGLLLDGLTSTSTSVTPVLIKTVLATPLDADRYSSAPIWNGEEFVFVGEPGTSAEDIYYFDPEDTSPHTYYCVAKDGSYDIYGINNIAMANLSTRVNNTESEVESWTRFQKGQNETMTSINQTSDEAGAAISSMVYGDFRECVEIKLELTEEEKTTIPTDRYNQQPKWENQKFVFESDQIEDGEYCSNDDTSYYKLLYRDGDVVGYEKYQMKSSPYAAVVQKVDADGNAYAGLVAGDDSNIGSMFVNSINDYSTATINADKIILNSSNETVETKLITEAGKISQIVEAIGEDGEVTAASIIQSINDSGSTTKIKSDYLEIDISEDIQISAKNVMIDGTTTFESLFTEGTTTIDGSKITTGTIVVSTNDVKIKETDESLSSLLDTDDDLWGTTVIKGGRIKTGSITADKIATDAIQSKGYKDENTTVYSDNGTFFNLADGSIASKNFAIDTNGNAYFKGEVNATSGTIGNMTITDKLYFGGNSSYYINANYNDSSYYIYLPGFQVDKRSSAVFSGTLSAPGGNIGGFTIGDSCIQSSNSYYNNVYIGTDQISLGNGNFYVTSGGYVYANSGNIGGCEIENGDLKIGNANISTISIDKLRLKDDGGSVITGYDGKAKDDPTDGICMYKDGNVYRQLVALTDRGAFFKIVTPNSTSDKVQVQMGVVYNNETGGCSIALDADQITINGKTLQFEKA